jgi:hypothetical protein
MVGFRPDPIWTPEFTDFATVSPSPHRHLDAMAVAAAAAMLTDHTPIHDGFWILGMGGAFFGSTDFLYRALSCTPARTAVDSDNAVRFVIAYDDPACRIGLTVRAFRTAPLRRSVSR